MTDKDDPRIAAVKAATEKYENARQAVEKVVLDALRAPGAKPTRIAAVSPWTAAHVRKLARDHGIQADPAYQQRTEAIRKRAAEAGQASESAEPAPRRLPPAAPLLGMSEAPAELELSDAVKRQSVKAARILLKSVESEHPAWAAEQRAQFADVEQRWFLHALLQAAANAGHVELPAS